MTERILEADLALVLFLVFVGCLVVVLVLVRLVSFVLLWFSRACFWLCSCPGLVLVLVLVFVLVFLLVASFSCSCPCACFCSCSCSRFCVVLCFGLFSFLFLFCGGLCLGPVFVGVGSVPFPGD